MSVSSIKNQLQSLIKVCTLVLEDEVLLSQIDACRRMLLECFSAGGKLLIAGNGGSAADAQHFSAEIVGRYKRERRAYPAIALTTDTSILTAWPNDKEFASVFARQIQGLGKPKDVFIGISTSGNSANIIEAVAMSKSLGLHTIGLLGNTGGKLAGQTDITITVPSTDTPRIQELHGWIIHALCEEIEKEFGQ